MEDQRRQWEIHFRSPLQNGEGSGVRKFCFCLPHKNPHPCPSPNWRRVRSRETPPSPNGEGLGVRKIEVFALLLCCKQAEEETFPVILLASPICDNYSA